MRLKKSRTADKKCTIASTTSPKSSSPILIVLKKCFHSCVYRKLSQKLLLAKQFKVIKLCSLVLYHIVYRLFAL